MGAIFTCNWSQPNSPEITFLIEVWCQNVNKGKELVVLYSVFITYCGLKGNSYNETGFGHSARYSLHLFSICRSLEILGNSFFLQFEDRLKACHRLAYWNECEWRWVCLGSEILDERKTPLLLWRCYFDFWGVFFFFCRWKVYWLAFHVGYA